MTDLTPLDDAILNEAEWLETRALRGHQFARYQTATDSAGDSISEWFCLNCGQKSDPDTNDGICEFCEEEE